MIGASKLATGVGKRRSTLGPAYEISSHISTAAACWNDMDSEQFYLKLGPL